ncbi:MAG: hypothetical protein LUC94_07035, partial [Clostridiales bacterium]|nr:hypothetical protein [Clostridiales bacterium]
FYKCQNDYDGTYAKILNEFSQTRDLLNQDGNRILSEVRRGNLIQKESLWGQIYNNTVQGSQWFRDNAVSPGRWAVGYPFLYVLYNVLEHMKPSNILEMGLGQSTKMITQYASTYPGIRHTVVEQNAEWVNFFCQNCYVAPNTSVEVLECGMENFRDAGLVRVYKGFEKLTMNKAYDFICIDGPSAEGMEFYSRIDVLKLLEKGLKDQFVIILDDCNRKGERCTAEMISSLLTEYNIDFSQGKYQGEKMFYIWTTKKYSFLCTL